MPPFIAFAGYLDNGGDWHQSGALLLDSKTEKEASAAAIAKADSLFPVLASNVLIRVYSDDCNGHPIAELRRPLSP